MPSRARVTIGCTPAWSAGGDSIGVGEALGRERDMAGLSSGLRSLPPVLAGVNGVGASAPAVVASPPVLACGEGAGVTGEHAKLDRLLEHFDGRIRRRSEVEQGHARPPAWVTKGRGGLTGSAGYGGRDLATMED